ncbi:MAG TPA: protocatechuate 3,4-dioxygenase [Prosthecobacter sp.]|nr:protocatechuate 3,4-dioxygenase [Prosthecobacter sp.]
MPPSRRHFLQSLSITAAGLWIPGAFAEALIATPHQTEGPFYPDKLPLDTDNDLIVLSDSLTPAVGEITHLSGCVLDLKGNPVRNAIVEIWQCDSNGSYLHSRSSNRTKYDSHFQGFGRFETGADGGYRFRTIKPVAYPGRTPHIHVKVKQGSKELLTTQLYIKGHPQNNRDGVLKSIRDDRARDSVMVAFSPMPGSKAGELAATCDIVLGLTPAG